MYIYIHTYIHICIHIYVYMGCNVIWWRYLTNDIQHRILTQILDEWNIYLALHSWRWTMGWHSRHGFPNGIHRMHWYHWECCLYLSGIPWYTPHLQQFHWGKYDDSSVDLGVASFQVIWYGIWLLPCSPYRNKKW